jgi:hypothetical protein
MRTANWGTYSPVFTREGYLRQRLSGLLVAGRAPDRRCCEAAGPAPSTGFPPPSSIFQQPPLQQPLQGRECAVLGRAVLAEPQHLGRPLDCQGLPSGAAPRALVGADVKWVWALREGAGEDKEGARCAADALRPRPWRPPSPIAADRWPAPGLAEQAHGAVGLPAPGRVPRRPRGLAGASKGSRQVCARAITFGGLQAGGSQDAGFTGCVRGCFVSGRGLTRACWFVAGHRHGNHSSSLEFQLENSLSRRLGLLIGKSAEGAALFYEPSLQVQPAFMVTGLSLSRQCGFPKSAMVGGPIDPEACRLRGQLLARSGGRVGVGRWGEAT